MTNWEYLAFCIVVILAGYFFAKRWNVNNRSGERWAHVGHLVMATGVGSLLAKVFGYV